MWSAALEPRGSHARKKQRCVWSRFTCLFGGFEEEHELVASSHSKSTWQKTSEPSASATLVAASPTFCVRWKHPALAEAPTLS